jgi:hypothetical protein
MKSCLRSLFTVVVVPALACGGGDADDDLVATPDAPGGAPDAAPAVDAVAPAPDAEVAPPVTGLVINEVDYDQYNTDATSFVELYNGTGAALDLSGLALVIVNGATAAESSRVELAPMGTLAAGGFAVVGNEAVVATLPDGVPTISVGAVDFMQNNGPDGVLLVDAARRVLDALVYEGAIATCTLEPAGAAVEVTIPDSGCDLADTNGLVDGGEDFNALARATDGVDTDDGNADWALVTPGTPGAANP